GLALSAAPESKNASEVLAVVGQNAIITGINYTSRVTGLSREKTAKSTERNETRFGLVDAIYPPSIRGDDGITSVRCLIQFVVFIGPQRALPLQWQAEVIPNWSSGSVSGEPFIH